MERNVLFFDRTFIFKKILNATNRETGFISGGGGAVGVPTEGGHKSHNPSITNIY